MSTASQVLNNVTSLAAMAPNPWKVIAISMATYAGYRVLKRYIYYTYFSSLRVLPGPKPPRNYLLGHLKEIFESSWGGRFDEWLGKFGSSITYTGFLWQRGLITSDPRAVAHMINHAYDFPKPWPVREDFIEMFGMGDVHKRQRKIMNPCFGPAQIRDLMPVFYEKALQLREIWTTNLDGDVEGKVVDILPWLTRTTLDVIGAAGFGYEFNSLTEEDGSELAQAYKALLEPPKGPGRLTENKRNSKATTDRIGRKIIEDKRRIALGDKGAAAGRDILSVLRQSVLDPARPSCVQKDSFIIIPIISINRDKAIWGEDADKLKPERWLENSHPYAAEYPTVFSGIMTFLGGARACIGYRLAVMEIKVILFTLLRNFVFELSDPNLIIETLQGMIARPVVKREDGSTETMLPLLIKCLRSD
ncbi:hypothetical protein FRC00_008720 [Tulasnella sp. 408]|nr:hypothetical protein FRC00_008720 [Tulasnella sp. 408]